MYVCMYVCDKHVCIRRSIFLEKGNTILHIEAFVEQQNTREKEPFHLRLADDGADHNGCWFRGARRVSRALNPGLFS